MKSALPDRKYPYSYIAVLLLLFFCSAAYSSPPRSKNLQAGVAVIDITPEWPVRLAGFGVRTKDEAAGTLLPLKAKALALGDSKSGISVIITVDLIGIPWHVTRSVAAGLAQKAGIAPSNLAISASHTHSGPEVGNLLNILQYRGPSGFSDSLLPKEQMNRISLYVEQLKKKLIQVSLEAIAARKPALLSWTQGTVGFAKNRRQADGPVDHSLPLLKVTGENGDLKALFLNYSCHAVSLSGDNNKYHGDWVGEAQKQIEERHPGVVALHAVGCGADANPSLDGIGSMEPLQRSAHYGKLIADEADRLLRSGKFTALGTAPSIKLRMVRLPFAGVPDVEEMTRLTEDKTVKGYYFRLALGEIARGEKIPEGIDYPVQVWNFGKELSMVFLAGEVVSDYALRLKNELKAGKIWVNAYSNDVPCYIASKRALKDGRYNYESISSMYYYHKPSAFAPEVEDLIISAVKELIPEKNKADKPKK